MNPARRRLLAGAAAIAGIGGATYAARSLLGAASSEPQALRIPPLIDARKTGQAVSLKVQPGRTEFFPGRESATLGYNGNYLGPTIRLHRGDDVQITVANALDEGTTVHWHGLIIPGELDGGPHQLIRSGETWRPVLPVRQPAATLFYHSHVHDRTAEQVYLGLAGVLLVTDENERSLGLPSEYGVDDLPLVIQDRQFESGRLSLPGGMMTTMQGRRGDTILVNGTPNALARVPARRVRLRVVNGSNARIYSLSFEDQRMFHWIASEGGLLEAPVELRTLSLAPGERAELLVDFSNGRAAMLMTGPDANASMMMGGMGRLREGLVGVLSSGSQAVLAFQPGPGNDSASPLPSRLAERRRADASQAARRRRFVLNMGMGGMMGGGMGGMKGGGMGGGMGIGAINGRAFDMERIDERVRLGDTEIWEVSGEMMAHPFHVHGVHFEVISRAGRAPDVRDQGLRDTVLVKESVELLVQFTQPSGSAPFMYHCHILEHEDNGMMGQYVSA